LSSRVFLTRSFCLLKSTPDLQSDAVALESTSLEPRSEADCRQQSRLRFENTVARDAVKATLRTHGPAKHERLRNIRVLANQHEMPRAAFLPADLQDVIFACGFGKFQRGDIRQSIERQMFARDLLVLV